MATAIFIFSQKGGAGKSTTAVNLAASLAFAGRRTLLIDCDPQGSATCCSGIIHPRPDRSLSDVLFAGRAAEACAFQTRLPHLSVIPAPAEPTAAERAHLGRGENAAALRDAVAPLKSRFDTILLDTPASDWPFITQAAVAAEFVLFVLKSDFLSFRYLERSIGNVRDLKQRHNPALRSAGILMTMVDPSDPDSARVYESCRAHLGASLFKTSTRLDPQIGAGALRGSPLLVQDGECEGARCYARAAEELIVRVQ